MAKKKQKPQPKPKAKRYLNAMFVWLFTLAGAILFWMSFSKMEVFPRDWGYYVAGGMLAIALITWMMSKLAPKSHFVKMVNLILALCLVTGAVSLPAYQSKVTELFNTITGNTIRINFYVMNEKYRERYPELFDSTEVSEELSDYKDAVWLTTVGIDGSNQYYALKELNQKFGGDVQTSECTDAYTAAASLYRGEGDVLILSASFVSMIEDIAGYETFSKETKIIGSVSRTIETSIGKSDTSLTKEPFSIFFGGNDGEGELSLQGRTDVNMIVTVNPLTHQVLIVSLPRDSYIPNPAMGGNYDKLTHLGVQGIDNTIAGLNSYLDAHIKNYVLINFTTFQQIIDGLGGIDLYNPYAFEYTWDDVYFEEGNIHLDGFEALYYVRERYNLPDGDFGRNMHQQIVMKAIISKLTSPAVISRFDRLLEALSGTFLTNVSSESIYALCRMQLDENIQWNIVNYSVTGYFGSEVCASAPGLELSIVYPDADQIRFVSEQIQKVMNGEILTQEELP